MKTTDDEGGFYIATQLGAFLKSLKIKATEYLSPSVSLSRSETGDCVGTVQLYSAPVCTAVQMCTEV